MLAARCAVRGLECTPRVTKRRRRLKVPGAKVERITPPGYHDFQCIRVSVPHYSGELELPMHFFLTLSLCSCFVPVEFRFLVTCSHSPSGAASKGRNQSATFGVFGPESRQSATSTFKFVECTTNHASRIKACKHCRSAKVLPS